MRSELTHPLPRTSLTAALGLIAAWAVVLVGMIVSIGVM